MMRFVVRSVLSVVVVVSCGVPPAFAQSAVSVSGQVTDQTGAPLPGVTIDLVAGGAAELTAVTDAQGGYRSRARRPPARPS